MCVAVFSFIFIVSQHLLLSNKHLAKKTLERKCDVKGSSHYKRESPPITDKCISAMYWQRMIVSTLRE